MILVLILWSVICIDYGSDIERYATVEKSLYKKQGNIYRHIKES